MLEGSNVRCRIHAGDVRTTEPCARSACNPLRTESGTQSVVLCHNHKVIRIIRRSRVFCRAMMSSVCGKAETETTSALPAYALYSMLGIALPLFSVSPCKPPTRGGVPAPTDGPPNERAFSYTGDQSRSTASCHPCCHEVQAESTKTHTEPQPCSRCHGSSHSETGSLLVVNASLTQPSACSECSTGLSQICFDVMLSKRSTAVRSSTTMSVSSGHRCVDGSSTSTLERRRKF